MKLDEYRQEQYLLAIERDGGLCRYCRKSAVDVHHKYGRGREAGDPREHYSNLECVCRECDQRIVDLRITNKNPLREGRGTLTFRTTMEEDIAGFHIDNRPKKLIPIVPEQNPPPHLPERLIPPPLLIPCKECITGRGASYAFSIHKHKDRRGIYVGLEHRDGYLRWFGPAEIVND